MTRLKAETGHSGVKRENISVITPRFKFGWRRVGPIRNILEDVGHVPVVGSLVDATVTETLVDRTPLEVWRQKKERTSVFDRETDIPFGIKENRTMGLTTGIDTMFYLWDKHAWAEERRSMAEGLRTGVYDANGDWSYDTWLRARSGLGPKVLSNLVQGALGPDHKPVPHFTEIMNLFEHSEDPHMRRREFWTDLAITLTAAIGPAAADFIMLKLAPPATETINNPQVLATTAGGAAGGALAGVLAGLALDALPAKDLPKAAKVAIPLATAILGAVGANFAVENLVIPGLDQQIEVTHIPLSEHGWTIPLVALGGAAIFGVPRFRKHAQIRDTVAEQLKEMSGWRDMFAMMASDVNYMSNVQAHWIANTPADPASHEAIVLNDKREAINRSIFTRYPVLYNTAMKFAHRDPDHITEMRALAGHDLKTLAEQVLMVEMVSFNQGFANRSKGKPNPTIQGFLPDPGTYFAMLDKQLLSATAQNCDLVKTLVDKKDPVAALTLVSPTAAQIMITQSQEGNLGANDDTMHFGEAGMNTGTRGAFVHLVAETFNQLLTVPDSKRAELMNQLHKLGDQFTKAVPIGGLDRIYSAPAHMRLGALYGYALLRSREHSLNDPADASTEGDYGSKGLLSDVGKAALQSMQANPLLGYMFLADLSVAIENADVLLPSISPRDKRTIKHALVSLRRELASEIIRERFPKDKATAVQFFTDGDYAFNAYLALTMLEEVCGNDVVQPLVAKQAAVLSPLFAQDDLTLTNIVVVNERRAPSVVKFNGIVGDTPNLYSTQLIDFIWNAERHPGSKVHEQLAEFLKRGMLPLLVREYFDRLLPSGRGEQFNEAQRENTVAFAGYALETVECDDLLPLAGQLVDVLEAFSRSAASSLAPLGTVVRHDGQIENQALDAFRRTRALIDVSNRLLAKRSRELAVPLPGHGAARVTLASEIRRLVKDLNDQVSTTVKTTVIFPPSSGKATP